MRRLHLCPVTATVCVFASVAVAENWPAWRGASGFGITGETNLPLRWSKTENVRWKVALPGPGSSTPIVWGNRVCLTQAEEKGKRRSTLCFDRKDGTRLWGETVEYPEREPTHGDNTYCSASPVTDGERIIVSHGSAGVFCYDLDGHKQWQYDVGKLYHIWGNASSPVIHGDLCLLNCGPGERTFLLALNKRTGTKVWQVDVPDGQESGDAKSWIGSWSTPVVANVDGRDQVLVSFPERLRGYDPKTGDELWSCAGLGRLVYTSPLVGEGAAVAMGGFNGPAIGVRLGGAKGDVTESHRLWRRDREQQRIGSGVITGGHVYVLNEPGIAECMELESGTTVWKERLGSASWSSMLLSGDRLYVLNRAGSCFVIRAATKFEPLAQNDLGEHTQASLAPSGGELFIRTYKHLWCITAADGSKASER
jgi:outer membrane protein assembly factor BamB